MAAYFIKKLTGIWWGMNISEARLYEFRQVTPHPNAAYYSIFRVCPTIENDAISDAREPPKRKPINASLKF
jgi:hypothetical protein